MEDPELQILQKEMQGLFAAMIDIGREPKVLRIIRTKKVGETLVMAQYEVDFRDGLSTPF